MNCRDSSQNMKIYIFSKEAASIVPIMLPQNHFYLCPLIKPLVTYTYVTLIK